jgi:hypothetical protein
MYNPHSSSVENFNTFFPGVDLTYKVHEIKLPEPNKELVSFSYFKLGVLQTRQCHLPKWCFIEHTEVFVIDEVKRDLALPIF